MDQGLEILFDVIGIHTDSDGVGILGDLNDLKGNDNLQCTNVPENLPIPSNDLEGEETGLQLAQKLETPADVPETVTVVESGKGLNSFSQPKTIDPETEVIKPASEIEFNQPPTELKFDNKQVEKGVPIDHKEILIREMIQYGIIVDGRKQERSDKLFDFSFDHSLDDISITDIVSRFDDLEDEELKNKTQKGSLITKIFRRR